MRGLALRQGTCCPLEPAFDVYYIALTLPSSTVDKQGVMSYDYEVPAMGHLQAGVFRQGVSREALEKEVRPRAKTAIALRRL
jgi:hypothetical protein